MVGRMDGSTLANILNLDSTTFRPLGRITPKPASFIRTVCRLHVQVDWGHKDVKTKMVDTHVLYREPRGVRSPMDKMPDG